MLRHKFVCALSRRCRTYTALGDSCTFLLADACHGTAGVTLAKTLLTKCSNKLAAVTQSSACAAEFRQETWEGDRLLTSSLDLTSESCVKKFLEKTQYTLGPDIDVLCANVGDVPSRWRSAFNNTTPSPLIHETRATEWIRLSKDVAAVGILVSAVLPHMLKSSVDSKRKVICVFSHSTPLHATNAVALRCASAALDELVAALRLELSRITSGGPVCAVRVHTPNLEPESTDARVWTKAVMRQIDRLREEEEFALLCDGTTLPIPGFPDRVDTFWYSSTV